MLGSTNSGRSNSLRLPLPDTLSLISNDSVAFRAFLLSSASKLNCPTAPKKLAGFPFSGSGFTLMVLLPAVTVLEDC